MPHRFSHWLTRQVGYDALLKTERRVAHRATAEALESRSAAAFGDARDVDIVGAAVAWAADAEAASHVAVDLAGHWERAGEEERSAAFAVLAAATAERMDAVSDGLTWCGRAIRAEDLSARAAAEWIRGRLLGVRGRVTDSLAAFEASDASSRAAPGGVPARIRARALSSRATTLARLGRVDEAEPLAREALSDARSASWRPEEASAWHALGAVIATRKDFAEAAAAYTRAAAIWRDEGDARGEAASLMGRGYAVGSGGDYEAAERDFLAARDLLSRTGGRRSMAGCLANLASIQSNRGRPDLAIQDLHDAVELFRAIGDPTGEAAALTSLADALDATGRASEAHPLRARATSLRSPV